MTQEQIMNTADAKLAQQLGNLLIQNTRFAAAIEGLNRDKQMLSVENRDLKAKNEELEKKLADQLANHAANSGVVQPVLDQVAPPRSGPVGVDSPAAVSGKSEADKTPTATAASPAEPEK